METGISGHFGLKLGQGCQLMEYASNIGDSDAEHKTTLFLQAKLG